MLNVTFHQLIIDKAYPIYIAIQCICRRHTYTQISMNYYAKNQLLKQLKSFLFGSVELKEKCGKQYIYVHYCLDGVLTTKDGIFLF